MSALTGYVLVQATRLWLETKSLLPRVGEEGSAAAEAWHQGSNGFVLVEFTNLLGVSKTKLYYVLSRVLMFPSRAIAAYIVVMILPGLLATSRLPSFFQSSPFCWAGSNLLTDSDCGSLLRFTPAGLRYMESLPRLNDMVGAASAATSFPYRHPDAFPR